MVEAIVLPDGLGLRLRPLTKDKPELVRRGALGVYRLSAWWRAVGTVKDLQRLEGELKSMPRSFDRSRYQ